MDWREEAFRSALKMVENGSPRNLITRVQPEAQEHGTQLDAGDLTSILQGAAPTSGFLSALGMQVHKWDAADGDEEWTAGTATSTAERRDLVCELLGLDSTGAGCLLERRPIFRDETVVITAPWTRWYTSSRAMEHEFYWPRYKEYLLNVRRWPDESVTSLDLTTTDVVERLTDPTREEAHQTKGLVVGYVQSGKTANFTGVVAKAIDAGYRLIIIMTGTIELLRIQTQRRIDMEMVGRQNILGDIPPEQAGEAKIDYNDDPAWLDGRFLDLGHGEIPTEIIRLTQHKADYKKLRNEFKILKMERAAAELPLYRGENLYKANARLAVVKKNATVLGKLVGDIKANRRAFAEIPVLIIDDESDEASPNTVDPEKIRRAHEEGKEIQARRAINGHIAAMLELMPRAQYVGYTATPFANVFVDPSDPLGIFPGDFVIGLSQPPGYMGVEDFHDLEEMADSDKTFANSNERAFVRDLTAAEDDEDGQDEELKRSIDMFVLTGAVKLYRSSMNAGLEFRHHTMLVHHSVKISDQKKLAERVKKLWLSSEYTQPSARARLRDLYEKDLRPVSGARLEAGTPRPPDFATIEPFVPKSIARITEHDLNPVIVVNSDKDVEQQQLDFDLHSTWRILVGGAKLSRGFTVEGLTITYFRRATDMSATLTQMGRWFGFRPGYRDLVRLYIARRARFGKRELDLYEAFWGVAMDEAAFRAQLQQYAEWDGDKPRLVPSQIPPLVTQHLPWLRPVAKNKMFNAVLEEQSEQPFTPTGYPNHVDKLKENLDRWRPILAGANDSVAIPQGRWTGTFNAFVGVVTAAEVIAAMEHCHYLDRYKESAVRPKTSFYRRLIREGALKDFLVVMPQPDNPIVEVAGVGPRRTISRDRRIGRGGNFGEITDPKHRPGVEQFVSVGGPAIAALASWSSPKRGAILVYLVQESHREFDPTPPAMMGRKEPEYGLVVAYSAYVPSTALALHPSLIRFHVRLEGGPPSIDVLPRYPRP